MSFSSYKSLATSHLIAMLLISTISACGGGSGAGSTDSSSKNLAITVTGSRSFNPDIDHGKIDYNLVSVSADDMEDPVTERVGGDAEGATVLGVPVGTSRTITIEAYNMNGLVIRRAVKEGVTIYADAISKVDVAMHTVPIFTNITSGSAVSGNRLDLGVFGEPGSNLTVVSVGDEEETPMIDASTNVAYVETTAEDGLFSFDPGTMEYGSHTFKVEDTETHESSSVTVSLYKSLTRPGASFGFGGSAVQMGSEIVVRNLDSMGRSANVANDNAGNIGILDIADTMLQ